MNLASLDFALSQISSSVANLTKKTYKQSVVDINHLTTSHGQEAERHLFRCLFSNIDFTGDGKSNNGKDVYQIQLLQQECSALIAKPNCTSVLCFAVENPFQRQKTLRPSPQLLSQVSKVLKLNRLQEVVFGVNLLSSSNPDLKLHAKIFTRLKFPDLISSFLDTEGGSRESGLYEAHVEVLHKILVHLQKGENPSGTSPELKQQFLAALHREFPPDKTPVVLLPLLHTEHFNQSTDQLNPTTISISKHVMETNLSDCLREIGYACTIDKDRCRQTLTQLGGVREVTAKAVAQVLGMMARTITGLQDGLHMQTLNMPNTLWVAENRPEGQHHQQSWNVDVFVQVVQELSPSLNWREVVKEFDHPGFLILSKIGLQLVVIAIRKALHGAFPIEELYKPWTNSEGQLSWFVYALNNPDVFCFATFQRQHIPVDMLKAPPDDDNLDIATWKSSELVESLLRLSDLGHYQQVSELFKFPVQHCPDLLVINLLQSTVQWNTLKKELLISLIPMFLGNHPNSGSVLQYVWNCQSNAHVGLLRTLVMFCMADWYLRGGDPNDQTRLSRILDVAQDLKALSMLLNVSQFTFVVDLACLASRREYLKLDKWLTDKIKDHGEPFIEAVVLFLKRRCPVLMGYKEDIPPQQVKGQLSLDTVGTILAMLQHCLGNLRSEELVKDINQMITNAGQLLSKPRPIPQMSGVPMMGITGAAGVPPPSAIENTFNNLPNLQAPAPGGSPAKFSQANNGTTAAPGMPGSVGASMPNMQNVRQMAPQPDAMMMAARVQPQSLTRNMPPNMPMPPPAAPTQEMPFSTEVEDEANAYFQKIYNQPPNNLSIEEVLEMLKAFKDSGNRRERDVFSCMLRNLFEENRFFPQYPDRELQITALLFGGIIEQGLVHCPIFLVFNEDDLRHMALGLALKYVLEALKQEPNSKMYMFGLSALDRFKSRLRDCAQYCQHIVSIAHFKQFPPHLIEYVTYGKLGQEPSMSNMPSAIHPSAALPPAAISQPAVSGHQSMPAAANNAPPPVSAPASAQTANVPRAAGVIGLRTNAMTKPSLAHTTNIDTLLAGADERQELSVPPEATQDRVFFIFNNLSQMNMQQKAEELLQALHDEFVAWTAQYLVMKRASIEPNFHPLYSSFLDVLDKAPLNARVLLETFRNIKVLLRSDKGVSNFSDRSLLKNLGHWLGLVTLAKNKPILQLDLDLKALLYEANSKGSEDLLYVVPFVAKVLESCEKSRIFRPPNPWTLGIIRVLCELHQQPGLKLNLKFEIEVLCKNLRLEIQEITPTTFLSDESYMTLIECQLTDSRPRIEPEVMMNAAAPRGSSIGAPDIDQPAGSTQPAPGAVQQAPVRASPQPQYAYSDINIASVSALAPHIHVSEQLPLFQMHKTLRNLVRPILERSISELLMPVVERSNKIALTTCENIIKKDFALDPEEQRMMGAAHHLVRSMTAGMALITCRDLLLISIQNNLKQAFLTALRGNLAQQTKELIEQAAQVIAQDNTELACAYIQKTAVEKALPEIDKRLASEFDCRISARQEGRRYCDPIAQRYQVEMMPEPIRLKPGSADPQQMTVYEEFARNVPGFAASSTSNNSSDLLGQQNGPHNSKQHANFVAIEICRMYETTATELSQQLQNMPPAAASCPQQMAELQGLVELLKGAMQSRGDIQITILPLIQKTVNGFLEHYNNSLSDVTLANRFREFHIYILKGLQDPKVCGVQWTNKHVTRCLTDCREDYRFNEGAIECLIKMELVNLPVYDYSLAQSMENGLNYMAVNLAMKLVQKLIVEEKGSDQIAESDFTNTIDTLAKISTLPRQAPDELPALIEAIRKQDDGGLLPGSASGPTSMMQSGINQAKDTNDPPGLREKIEYLLREWVHMYHNPNAGRDSLKGAFTSFINQMSHHGILKSDELITRFFRLCTYLCVENTYSTLKNFGNQQALVRAQCFKTLDAYVRLIVLLVKLSGDSTNTMTKINLLNKVLGIATGFLLLDHEARGKDFQQLPYHRIFIMLFIELNAPEVVLDAINFQVLTAFVNTYRILRPAKVPGFAFAWLELISHRAFIGRMLQLTAQQRGWNMYAQLLIDLFRFLAPFLRNADLNRAMQVLYKGTLRVLLVLLHDFPEFLCDYHYAFCDVIPSNCIQMRNLILSAFPRNMRLPDPFTPNLKVDMLTEIAHAPKIMTNIPAIIQPEKLKKELDSYLKTRTPATFTNNLRANLQITNDPGNRYNIPLMNALVLYVGTQAIQSIQSKGMSPSTGSIAQSSHMDIFQNLSVDLDTEGRYLFLNAITNQLRFPNSHTHYFSCALLSLFAEAHSVALQEQITRVLLERLIVNRPHPWGLLVTFIELIRNQSYKFWGHDFVHCSPEIERLFETVARSCNQNRSQQPANAAPSASTRSESELSAM